VWQQLESKYRPHEDWQSVYVVILSFECLIDKLPKLTNIYAFSTCALESGPEAGESSIFKDSIEADKSVPFCFFKNGIGVPGALSRNCVKC